MRIATWNVNGLRARLEFLALRLRERRPDLVGLQELKLTEEQSPHALFETEGYGAVVHGQKAWNGVAILSRHPVTVTQKGLPGQEESGARLISADAGGLSFTTVYCPNGKDVGHPDFPRKLGLRLDLLLATPDIAEPLRSVEFDRDYRKKKDDRTPSDHAPVFADL
jgi:exodeoxyribonuclease-3